MKNRLLLICLCFAVAFIFLVFGYVCGSIQGAREAYNSRFLRDKELIDKVLSKDPAFARIEIDRGWDDDSWLVGEVDTEEDYYRLRRQLIEAFGTQRTDHMIGGVRIREEAKVDRKAKKNGTR